MIKEAYVSFEVAKLLKEKGFNEKCRGSYHCEFDDNDNSIVMLEEWMAQPYNNDFVDEGFLCSAPTHQMAMKWLRTEKYVIIFILPALDDLGNFAYAYDIAEWNESEGIYEMNHMSSWFYTYEEAVEAALKYSLENLI